MGDYNLAGLNPRDFEHLVQSLAKKHIASGVRPFGDGRDGGREATFHGKMDYPSGSDPWEGYLVIADPASVYEDGSIAQGFVGRSAASLGGDGGRWTRPLNKSTGEPIPRRRSVHLLDWLKLTKRLVQGPTIGTDDGFPSTSPAEIEQRKASVGQERRLGK